MSEQDWNNLIIHDKNFNPLKPKIIQPKITQTSKQLKEIDSATDVGKLKQLEPSDRQLIISSRNARKMKQDQIAQSLSMPVNLYKDIENGKTIPTQQQLNKINNFLKINVKLS